MAHARKLPFEFHDFAAAKRRSVEKSAPDLASSLTDADLDAARDEGFQKGLAEARADIAARDAAALEKISATLAEASAHYAKALNEALAAVETSVGAFLKSFCRGLIEQREAEAAIDLVTRLISASAERTPATLYVSPESLDAIGARIHAAIDEAGAADFITLAADASLGPGDCRLAWRGGAATRSLKKSLREIDRFLSDLPRAQPLKAQGGPNPENDA